MNPAADPWRKGFRMFEIKKGRFMGNEPPRIEESVKG